MSQEWSTLRRPEALPSVDTVMSNFGHTLDLDAGEVLRAGCVGHYAGWNFSGRVWWTGVQFACEIWCYRCYEGTAEAETLEDIMEMVSDRYGHG